MVEKLNIAKKFVLWIGMDFWPWVFFWGVWLGLLTKTWLEDANLLDKTKEFETKRRSSHLRQLQPKRVDNLEDGVKLEKTQWEGS